MTDAAHPQSDRRAEPIAAVGRIDRACRIHAFGRYGVDWLGDDHGLRDATHFEFLGDPERILAR